MNYRRAKALASLLAMLCVCVVAFVMVGHLGGVPVEGVTAGRGVSDASQSADPAGPELGELAVAADAEAPGVVDAEAASDLSAYEPGFVLATLAAGATPDSVAHELAANPALAGVAFDSEISDTTVKLSIPAGVDVADAADLISAAESIDVAQPNYRLYTQGESGADVATAQLSATAAQVADATFATQDDSTPLTNDTFVNRQWSLPSVKAAQAWNHASSLSGPSIEPVTVAVLDAGFDVNHEDLKNNIIATYDITKNTTDISPVNTVPKQTDHGTHSASIIAAQTNNSMGVASVTNNTCKLFPIRVEDEEGNLYVSDVARALEYVYNNADRYNIRVVNMSLGGSSGTPVSRATSPALYDPIDKLRNDKGILTVVAACNNGTGGRSVPFYAYPSDFDNVVSVIGLTQSSSSNYNGVARSSSSNYNKGTQRAKEISAPGDQVAGAVYRSTYDTSFEGKYANMSGTSMAAPLVAGVAALMFHANPTLTPQEVESKLYSTATKLGSDDWDAETGYGEVNAAAALRAAAPYFDNPPASIAWNKTATFKIRLDDAEQSAASWTWTSSNTSVAVVSASGIVTPCGNGSTTISASKDGVTLSQKVSVSWPVLSGASSLNVGESTTFSVSVGGAVQSGWTWETGDANVATVSSTGVVTAVGPGDADISAANGFLKLTRRLNVTGAAAESGEGGTGSESSAGTGSASGAGTGTEGGTGAGTGSTSGTGAEAGTGSGAASGTGAGTNAGNETSAGTGTGGSSGTTSGSNAGSGSGGDNAGSGSNAGTEAGTGGSSGTGGDSSGDSAATGVSSDAGGNASGSPSGGGDSSSSSGGTGGTSGTGGSSGDSASGGTSGSSTSSGANSGSSSGTGSSQTSSAAVEMFALSVSVPDLVYTGTAQQPSPIVYHNGKQLVEGRDYYVSSVARIDAPSTACTDAGTYAVTISAASGKFTGSVTKTFHVNKADIGTATVKLSATKLEYTGSKLKANVTSVTMRLAGEEHELTLNRDYTLTNPGTKKGTAKVTVKGTGNFTGEATASYTVKVVKTKVYQLYNRETKQWSYTSSSLQYSRLKKQGWKGRGVAFSAPTRSAKPVYLMEREDTGAHRLAVGTAKMRKMRASGWESIHIAFYASDYQTKRVYTFYNEKTKAHRYSTAKSLAGFTRTGVLCRCL